MIGSLVLLGVLLIVGGVLFRLNQFQYGGVTVPNASLTGPLPARINRITGVVDEYVGGRWLAPSRARRFPPAEQAKVFGYAGMSADGTFTGNFYNGSRWTITRVVVRIGMLALKDRPGAKPGPLQRTVPIELPIPPNSVAEFRVPQTDQREMIERQMTFTGWTFDTAFGYP
jgi:hypothetical protein